MSHFFAFTQQNKHNMNFQQIKYRHEDKTRLLLYSRSAWKWVLVTLAVFAFITAGLLVASAVVYGSDNPTSCVVLSGEVQGAPMMLSKAVLHVEAQIDSGVYIKAQISYHEDTWDYANSVVNSYPAGSSRRCVYRMDILPRIVIFDNQLLEHKCNKATAITMTFFPLMLFASMLGFVHFLSVSFTIESDIRRLLFSSDEENDVEIKKLQEERRVLNLDTEMMLVNIPPYQPQANLYEIIMTQQHQ